MQRVVSCYANCYGPDGVEAAVEHLGELGLGYVELPLRGHDQGGLIIPESSVVTLTTPEPIVASFLDLLRDRRVAVSGANVGGGDLRSLEGFALTGDRIQFARERFGAKVAVSAVGRPANPDERSRIVGNLRLLGDLARNLGMLLNLETHGGPTQNAAAMLDLMSEVDHPSIRINFDTGNIAYYNEGADPVHELRQIKTLVGSVHLKDNRGRFEDWYFPSLGDGPAVDFVQVRQILDDDGFLGPYTIEIEGIGGEPEPGLNLRRERVARSVDHLARCGFFS